MHICRLNLYFAIRDSKCYGQDTAQGIYWMTSLVSPNRSVLILATVDIKSSAVTHGRFPSQLRRISELCVQQYTDTFTTHTFLGCKRFQQYTEWALRNVTLSKWRRNQTRLTITSHPHQSVENSGRFVPNYPGDYCCCLPPLDATRFENGKPTTEELGCSAVSEKRV